MKLLLLYIFFSIFANSKVILYEYELGSHLLLNGKILRETIKSQYFAYTENIPITHINYTTKIYKTSRFFKGSTLLNDYKNSTLLDIGNIVYNTTKPHIFHYVINVITDSFLSYNLILSHNNIKLKNIISRSYQPISLYDMIILPKGFHSFNLYITSSTKNICNCPSIKDGYQNTRYFFGWLEYLQNDINNMKSKSGNMLNNLMYMIQPNGILHISKSNPHIL